MRRVIYALLSLFLFIQVFSEEASDLPYSAPDQIVALTQESGKIRKIINPLSGQPCLRQTDLIAKGAQDVVLRRTFISQHRDWYANGKVLRYRYNQKKELIRVESLDPKERYVYASIDIDSAPSQPTSKFLTHSGRAASYQHEIRKSQAFPKDTRALNLLSISAVSSPLCPLETISLDKALLNQYSGRRNLFACQYAESGEHLSKNKKVSKLLLPGESAQFYAIHEFSYEPPLIGEKQGKTYVKNIDSSYVIYKYSPQLLLTAIKHFDANAVLKKKKRFYWTPNHWLSRLAVSDGNGYLLYKKEYQYDRYGNPVLEVFCGDIIGKSVYENISIARKFSKDGRHLLLKEKHDDGKTLSFQYLPNTDLISTKLTQENDRIVLRECYEYDDCHNLIKAIKDNGTTSDPNNLSGVTQRTVTNYILRSQPPFLHLPEWIEEKYLENGSEKFLKSTHLTYDTHGNICEETIYDANGVFAYTMHKSYNDQGNVII